MKENNKINTGNYDIADNPEETLKLERRAKIGETKTYFFKLLENTTTAEQNEPSSRYAVFIDVGYLRAEGKNFSGNSIPKTRIQMNTKEIADWCRGIEGHLHKTYWYDGAYPAYHKSAKFQRKILSELVQIPDFELRLGRIVEIRPKNERDLRATLNKMVSDLGQDPIQFINELEKNGAFEPEHKQKGVDTLLVLDLVMLAQQGKIDKAVLIAGDGDFTEAVRVAQNMGTRVSVATPNRNSVSRELSKLADNIIDLDKETLNKMTTVPPNL